MTSGRTLRIVSLIPGGTEIVAALGLGEHLVGRSHECDFPPTVAALPACSRSLIDSSTSSDDINNQVRGRMEQAVSLYELDWRRIAELQPTHLITQTQCDVCAVSLQEVERELAQRIRSRPTLISLAPHRLEDVWKEILFVADVLGVAQRGCELVAQLNARLERVRSFAEQSSERPRVLCVEWLTPLMIAGHWTPELITVAGGEPVLTSAGAASRWILEADLTASDPDRILLAPCGFSLAQTERELASWLATAKRRQLRAAQCGQLCVIDGQQFLNRSGPRLVESAEILAECLHPQLAPTQWVPHRDRHWRRGASSAPSSWKGPQLARESC